MSVTYIKLIYCGSNTLMKQKQMHSNSREVNHVVIHIVIHLQPILLICCHGRCFYCGRRLIC